MVVIQIDGMDEIESCYAFAGIVGISPKGLTLRQLWQMANGKIRAMRYHQVGQASTVWGMGSADPMMYAEFGIYRETGIGKPVEYSPEMQAKIDEEIAKIYAQQPHLKDRVKYGKG